MNSTVRFSTVRFAAACLVALLSTAAAPGALADATDGQQAPVVETSIRKAHLKSSLATYLFLNRNASKLKLVQSDACPMESLDKALALIGDDGAESSFTTLNLKVYDNRNVSSVFLSIGDDDGSTESGVSIEFAVNLRTQTIIKNEVRCFFAG